MLYIFEIDGNIYFVGNKKIESGNLMIYEADIHARKKLLSMFENIDSTILLSYLQGHMGTAWVDDLENPTVAQITVGIFAFYAGDPNAKETEELLLTSLK